MRTAKLIAAAVTIVLCAWWVARVEQRLTDLELRGASESERIEGALAVTNLVIADDLELRRAIKARAK